MGNAEAGGSNGMGASTRWLERLQRQWMADPDVPGASPYDPSLDPGLDGADPTASMYAQAVDSSSQPQTESADSSPRAPASLGDRLIAGASRGGVGGGLAALFADPDAPRGDSGANAWDAFSGIARGIGRALGSAYGNPGFAIAARQADTNAAHVNASLARTQLETEKELREQAEKRARSAAVMRAMQGIDPTTRSGNAEAVNRLVQMGEHDIAQRVSQLYRPDAESKPPATRTVQVGTEKVESEWDPSTRQWHEIARGPAWNPKERGTSVTVSPQIIMPGHAEPTTATSTAVQGKTLDLNNMLSRLDETQRTYDPAYQQLGTKAKMWASQWTEKLGGSLSPEDADQLDRYTTFRATAFDNLSQTLKEMSGAAVTPQEYDRLKQSLPNPGTGIVGSGDSPTAFEAKLRRANRSTRLALIRYGYAQEAGIPFDGIPLDVGTLKQRIGEKIEKDALAAGHSQQDAEALAVDAIKRRFRGL